MAQDTNSVLGGLIIHIEGVNLASSVIWSTYANKCTKALKTGKGSYVSYPKLDQNIDIIIGELFDLIINTYQ